MAGYQRGCVEVLKKNPNIKHVRADLIGFNLGEWSTGTSNR
jgi:hypothetical protein